MLIAINPEHPEPRKLRRAAEALAAGEVIGYPTDTVYGLGCDLTNKRAIDRLCAIKGLEPSHHLTLVCPDLSEIARYAIVENQTYRILRRFVPGPYCFVLTATREVPKLLLPKRKTVGIRVPNHAVTRALALELGRPIASTTASRPGADPLVDPDEIDDIFVGLAMVLDAGAGGLIPSSVIDLTTHPPTVVREGAGPVDEFL
ncbi:MAG: L-threonylcarbamoyladenylate synthase [Myxococcales bacterium]|jgi:tRNA threonylcarbamoyl adenosine modification protein (Sua5/YciO/YrdC/YwlC family)